MHWHIADILQGGALGGCKRLVSRYLYRAAFLCSKKIYPCAIDAIPDHVSIGEGQVLSRNDFIIKIRIYLYDIVAREVCIRESKSSSKVSGTLLFKVIFLPAKHASELINSRCCSHSQDNAFIPSRQGIDLDARQRIIIWEYKRIRIAINSSNSS